jgi:hypothetical protein
VPDFSNRGESDGPLKRSEVNSLQPTIVGGRPEARDSGQLNIPLGIQTLIKKAAVDGEFRSVLLKTRAEAAREIDLQLTRSEILILSSIPKAQLETIIENTTVPVEHRRVFLGKLAAAMLALLAAGLPTGCDRYLEPGHPKTGTALKTPSVPPAAGTSGYWG